MIRKLFVRALLALAVLPALQSPVAAEPAPAFTLPTDRGQISLAEQHGKVVYLDFWASWCGPCGKSFPWMNQMAKQYGPQGLVIIAVNLDKERQQAQGFLQKLPADFTVAYDPQGDLASAFHVKGMPTSFLIDRNGQILAQHAGFHSNDTAALESAIQQALAH